MQPESVDEELVADAGDVFNLNSRQGVIYVRISYRIKVELAYRMQFFFVMMHLLQEW